MQINLTKLLDFLDNPRYEQRRHASSIVGVIGEDLNAAAYAHYRQGVVRVLEVKITQGNKKGKWLDRWIVDDEAKVLYQCEIKNWSASAIGGQVLPVDAPLERVAEVAEHYRKGLMKLFSSNVIQPNGITKVLLPMRRPEGEEFANCELRPLLIMWMPVTNDFDTLSPLFTINELPFTDNFAELEIFSVSLYLRSLLRQGLTHIELPMPNVAERLTLFEGFMAA